MKKQRQPRRFEYIAEGPGSQITGREFLGPIVTDLDLLANTILKEHLRYLKEEGYNDIAKEEHLCLTFSFEPTCNAIMWFGQIRMTERLNRSERKTLYKDLEKKYESLDDVFENNDLAL